ncbi:MAG TPA: hypothetical protein VFS92_03360 [Planctomycetota bacterium]|nr:hypothetical protein [Planctomycetota bacterium]
MTAVRAVPSLAVLAVAAFAAGCASSGAASAPEPEAAGRDHAAAVFAHFKGLAGTWKGDGEMGGNGQKNPVQVAYRLTAGGSAVEETLFCGSPHEMVTLYHLDGPRMLLTHYCAAGNQPTMVLVPGDDPAKPQFEFLRATNLADPKEGHMHRASFDFTEANRLRSRWTFFNDGKADGDAVIDVRKAN